jgi:hypothetical protein
MRWLSGRLGTRIGIALGLAAVIAVAVAIGKTIGPSEERPTFQAEPPPFVTANPTAGDDGVVEHSPSSYPDDSAVTTIAERFVEAWLRRDASATDWISGISTLATQALANDLSGVDPRTVPATRQTGRPNIVLRIEAYAKVSIPMDTGTLTLKIFKGAGRWLVGEVDWEPL